MTNPLSTLETELAVLATPASGPNIQPGGSAVPSEALTAVSALFTALDTVGEGIGEAIKTVAGDINTALDDAAQALELIAGKLEGLSSAATSAGTEATTVLNSLQNALSTAQSLLPGGPSVTGALQSGSQFFEMLGLLLSDISSITDATNTLYQIAQELRAIGTALAA
ncbi:MAG TPA: hypothetical protein VN845_00895 [Solirubrobacteraceae bacterium]|nr:hypothetical protein [Solirubrobacteraceae bacterium]